jgi:hypothetical protein
MPASAGSGSLLSRRGSNNLPLARISRSLEKGSANEIIVKIAGARAKSKGPRSDQDTKGDTIVVVCGEPNLVSLIVRLLTFCSNTATEASRADEELPID